MEFWIPYLPFEIPVLSLLSHKLFVLLKPSLYVVSVVLHIYWWNKSTEKYVIERKIQLPLLGFETYTYQLKDLCSPQSATNTFSIWILFWSLSIVNCCKVILLRMAQLCHLYTYDETLKHTASCQQILELPNLFVWVKYRFRSSKSQLLIHIRQISKFLFPKDSLKMCLRLAVLVVIACEASLTEF